MTSPTTFIADSTLDPAMRELDHRHSDGIDVRLLWNSRNNGVSVFVEDERSGAALRFDVAAGDALETFRHPYAYANRERAKRAPARAIEAR